MPRAKNRGKASSSFVAGNANRRRIDAESVKGRAKKRGGGAMGRVKLEKGGTGKDQRAVSDKDMKTFMEMNKSKKKTKRAVSDKDMKTFMKTGGKAKQRK